MFALAATVLAFIFVVPESKAVKKNAFLKVLHDILNFRYLIVEKILQALYILATAFTVLYGFFQLFSVTKEYNYWTGSDTYRWNGLQGLIMMILAPILIRVSYELLMMLVLLVKNVIGINNKLKNQNGDVQTADLFAVPKINIAPKPKAVPEVAPQPESQPDSQPAPQPAPHPSSPSFCT
ncbi:MAG: hypothetical protein IJU41_04110, partial [Clostridia bacterium]|nr:hypothetical protein [Clostridia bacterium]